MSVLGGENAGLTFLIALGVIAVFSGIFVRLNRDVWVEALTAAVAWSIAAVVFLGYFDRGTFWDAYWVFDVVAVGYIVGLGSLITLVRRRRLETPDEDRMETCP